MRVPADTVPEDGTQTDEERASVDKKPMELAGGMSIRLEEERRLTAQKEFLTAAQREWAAVFEEYKQNQNALQPAYEASKRLMRAEADARHSSADPSGPEAHLNRIRQIARIQHSNPSGTDAQRAQIDAFAAEAALWVADARANSRDKASTDHREPKPASGSDTGPGSDPRSRKIIAKLDEPIVMSFAEPTPLDDVLKHIKQKTQGPGLPRGIPIYVDPIGLEEAEKNLACTVIIDLDGVPLRRTLQLALAQLGLGYIVEDGMIYITSQDSADQLLPPALTQPSPLMKKLMQAERGELDLREIEELAARLRAYDLIRRHRIAVEGEGMVWDGSGGAQPPPGFGPQSAAIENAKRDRELLDLLMKETRTLIDALNAAKPLQKPRANPQ